MSYSISVRSCYVTCQKILISGHVFNQEVPTSQVRPNCDNDYTYSSFTLRSIRSETPIEKSLSCKSILFLFHSCLESIATLLGYLKRRQVAQSVAHQSGTLKVLGSNFIFHLNFFLENQLFFSIHKVANCTISLIFANLCTNLLEILSFSGQLEYQQNCMTFCGRFWGLAENFCIIRSYDLNV